MSKSTHPWAKLSLGLLAGFGLLVFAHQPRHARLNEDSTRDVRRLSLGAQPRGEGSTTPALAEKSLPAESAGLAPLAQREVLLAEITRALRTADDVALSRVLNLLWPALIREDCGTARQVLATVAPGPFRLQLLGRLARAWAAQDFPATIDWVAQLTVSEERATGFEEACFGAVATTPGEAIDAWDKYSEDTGGQVRENLVQAWAERDVTGAAAWVKAQPAGLGRDRAAARLAYVMAATKPAEAAQVVQQFIDAGPAQTEAMLSVLQRWARIDWVAAMNWAAGFADGELRSRAIDELVGVPHGGA